MAKGWMRHFSLRGKHGARAYQGDVQVTLKWVPLGSPVRTSGGFKSADLAYFNRLNMGRFAQLGP
jgi:hypothetical protein